MGVRVDHECGLNISAMNDVKIQLTELSSKYLQADIGLIPIGTAWHWYSTPLNAFAPPVCFSYCIAALYITQPNILIYDSSRRTRKAGEPTTQNIAFNTHSWTSYRQLTE